MITIAPSVRAKCQKQHIDDLTKDLIQTISMFGILILVGFLAEFFRCSTTRTASWMWSLACLACGAAIGFLFGIPRIRQAFHDEQTLSHSLAYRMLVNNNLEE